MDHAVPPEPPGSDAPDSMAAEIGALWQRLAQPRPRDLWAHASGAAGSPVDVAVRCFRLSDAERDVLVLLIGLMLARSATRSPTRTVRAGDVVDALAQSRDHATQILAALAPGGRLVRRAIVLLRGDGPWLDRLVELTDDFWPRLIGVWPTSAPRARALRPTLLDDLSLRPETRASAREIVAWLRSGPRAWPIVALAGPRGTGRRSLAEAISGTLGVPALTVEGRQLGATTAPVLAREVAWQQASLVVCDIDEAPPDVFDTLLAEIDAPLLVTTTRARIEQMLDSGRPARLLSVPPLGPAEQSALWSRRFDVEGIDGRGVDVDAVAARFAFDAGRITTAARSLADADMAPSTSRVIALCRTLTGADVGGLADRIECSHVWDDLVVPHAVRRELEMIVTWGRHGGDLFGHGGPGARLGAQKGLACLFHGPPGTGKTMAAQVIARTLDRDLLRVDLSQVIDKYIGETEKRLDALFRAAAASDAILFFDEADTLFARRTDVRDARDRYANLETGFLLQRLESHRGITLLASNLQRNLDAAFQRRLGVIAEFPLPAPAERHALWSRLLPPPAQRAGDIDLDFLASRLPLSGGDIRNAIISAILLAGTEALAMRHLVIGVWRELGKAGRLLDARDLGPWHDDVARYLAAGAPRP